VFRALEPVEGDRQKVRGKPGATVGDLDGDGAVRAAPGGDVDGVGGWAVADGVVQQVAHRLQQPVGVGGDAQVGWALDGDRWLVVTRPAPADGGAQQLVELDCDGAQDGLVVVHPGQQQQVLGQPDQPFGLPAGLADGPAQRRGVAVGAGGQFELGAQDGQRGAQLVAGVGDEPAFALQRVVQPVQQLVDGHAQRGDLVPGAGCGEASFGVVGADGGGLAAHAFDRAQRRGGEQPGSQAGQPDRDRPQDHERGTHAFDGVVGNVGAGADHHEHPGATRRRGGGEDAGAAAVHRDREHGLPGQCAFAAGGGKVEPGGAGVAGKDRAVRGLDLGEFRARDEY